MKEMAVDIQPVTAECLIHASAQEQVPLALILGLLKTEGGRLGMESSNRDGSIDLGPMQVNDRVWVPMLAKAHFGGNYRLAYEYVRDQGCYNIHVGTWIFRQYVNEAHGDYAEAIGLYNSHNPAPKRAYQMKFAKNFAALFAGRR